MSDTHWGIYIRRGVAYVPARATAGPGYFMDIEPVEVAPTNDPTKVTEAILRALERETTHISAPTSRADIPEPVVLRAAGVRSWSAFAKGTRYWGVSAKGAEYSICEEESDGHGGWGGPVGPQQILRGDLSQVAQAVAQVILSTP